MASLLILLGSLAVVTAGVALWLAGRRQIDRRYFAGSVAIAVTGSVFSIIVWVATATVHGVPLFFTWVFVSALSLLFALRLYRELQAPPSGEPR